MKKQRKNKRSGSYNRNRGHRAEQKIDNKVDIIDKNNKLPCYIQIKHTLQTPQYFSIREESTVPNEEFCIIWDKQKKCETNIVTVGSAVIMDKQLFYKLIKPYAKEK